MEGLVRLRDSRVIPFLQEGLFATRNATHVHERTSYASALRRLDSPKGLAIARRWLDDPRFSGADDGSARLELALLLVRYGDRRRLDVVRKELEADSYGSAYDESWDAVSGLGRKEANALLLPALEKPELLDRLGWETYRLACRLIRDGGRAALRAMQDRLEDNSVPAEGPAGGRRLLRSENLAELVSLWTDNTILYDVRWPIPNRMATRHELSKWLAAQAAMMAAGKANRLSDFACSASALANRDMDELTLR